MKLKNFSLILSVFMAISPKIISCEQTYTDDYDKSNLYVSETFIRKLGSARILVIGDIMLDQYIIGNVERISPEAPVPVVIRSNQKQVLGGAANVALNIQALGGNVELCGLIGNDEAGNRVQELLKMHSIKYDPCFIKPQPLMTIHKTRVLAQNQQICRIDEEASPTTYHIDSEIDISTIKDKLKSVDAVIFSDYAKGSITEALVKTISEHAQQLGVIICMDPKPINRIIPKPLYLLTPNRTEAMQMAGIKESHEDDPFPAEVICKAIWDQYKPTYLIITLGKDGILISQKGSVVAQIPTYARDVYDVSGAGDTVIAALTLALATKASIFDAVHLANIAAGIVVGKRGTATASIDEILKYQTSNRLPKIQ